MGCHHPLWRMLFKLRPGVSVPPGTTMQLAFDVRAPSLDDAEQAWRNACGSSYPNHVLIGTYMVEDGCADPSTNTKPERGA